MNNVINNNEVENLFIKFIADHLNKISGLSVEEKQDILKNAIKRAGLAAVRIPDEVLIIHGMMMEGSDRQCVLIGSAYLENELTKLLTSFFIGDEKINGLFEKEQPLSSFAARIDLSYALGLIPRGVRKDLRAISRIGRIVENDSQGTGLAGDEIGSLCNDLIYDVAPVENDSARKKIIRVVMGLASMIHNSMEKKMKCVPMNDKDVGAYRKRAEKLKAEVLQDCT